MARTSKERPFGSRRTAFIVDDHPVFRNGLAEVINSEKDLTVIGSAGSASEALTAICRLKPDLVLVDISLPDRSGLELLEELRCRAPNLKLLVVSMHDEALYVDRVLQLGGDGYIMKQEDPSEIVHAMRDVLDGHIYVSEQVLAGPSKAMQGRHLQEKNRPLDALTELELEILELLGESKNSEEIATLLDLDPEVIDAEYEDIRRKLKLRTENALIRYAVCWVSTGVTRTA